MEFNHWLRGLCMVPPTKKEGAELERHQMAYVLWTINDFEDMGFKVDRRSVVMEPCELEYGGVLVGFRYRPTSRWTAVYGV